MLKRLSVGRRQNGQGIVEYALLLAFILAIAIAMQGSGIDEAISNTFARVAHALGVETERQGWSTQSAADLIADTGSSAERLAADQDFLSKIGKHFLGMTKSDFQKALNVSDGDLNGINNNKTDNSGILLGNFTEEYKDGVLTTKFSINERNQQGQYHTPNTAQLYNWGLGLNSGTYDSSQRYLVSDFAVNSAATVARTGAGIKITNVSYDSSGKVSSLVVAINPKSGGGAAQGLAVKVE